MKKDNGVTIVELLVVIFVIGLFITFFTSGAYTRVANNARVNTTKQEMNQLRIAIAGNPDLVSSGEILAGGFKNDVGRIPRHLIELARRLPDTLGLDSMPIWNPFTKNGWNGPYMREDGQHGFMYDAWGEPYRFATNNTGDTVGLKSPGTDGEWYVPGLINDDIEVLF